MGAFPFKIYSQKHIISTEFYVEFMCFWDNALFPQIGICRNRAVFCRNLTKIPPKTAGSSLKNPVNSFLPDENQAKTVKIHQSEVKKKLKNYKW